MEKFVTTTPKETAKVARSLASRVRGGVVVALYGDLGVGKTTFAQAFAKALGIKKRVQSPTFILMQEYPIKKRGALKLFLHVDAYRGDEAQFTHVGFSEYAGRPDTVVLVEWAERVEKLLPKKRINVRLSHRGGDARGITITG